jgi:hypothetical protein
MLYAADGDAGGGPPDQVEERYCLNLQSQRRVLQLLDSPDPDSATANQEDAVVFTGQWGLGNVRGAAEFREHIGLDFEAGMGI